MQHWHDSDEQQSSEKQHALSYAELLRVKSRNALLYVHAPTINECHVGKSNELRNVGENVYFYFKKISTCIYSIILLCSGYKIFVCVFLLKIAENNFINIKCVLGNICEILSLIL